MTPPAPNSTNKVRESSQNMHSYSMDRIRLESIEKRKQECAQIIKERKRKLSELYCVARLPFVPISSDHVQHIEDKLMAFLEKNDLENGHSFDISFLSKEKIFRKSMSPQQQSTPPAINRSNSQQGNNEPPKKIRKIETPARLGSNESTPVPFPVESQKSSSPEGVKQLLPKIAPKPSTTQSSDISSPISKLIPSKVDHEGQKNKPASPKDPLTDSRTSSVEKTRKEEENRSRIADEAAKTADKLVSEVEKLIDTKNDEFIEKEKADDKLISERDDKKVSNRQDSPKVNPKSGEPNVSNELANDEVKRTHRPNESTQEQDIVPTQKQSNLPSTTNPVDASAGLRLKNVTEETHRIKHITKPLDQNDPPLLLDMVLEYAKDPKLKRADERSDRDLDYKDIDIKKLLITLMPETKPHKVAEARSLTELYYQQQTLQLQKLLLRAHKTLTTDAFEASLIEGKVSVLHSRIEELKRKNSWSLRQPRKLVDPFIKIGKKTHWDNLLSEAKWLATDFRQERRYKAAQCVYIAQAVLDYWTFGKVCCIKRAPINFLPEDNAVPENSGDNLSPSEDVLTKDPVMSSCIEAPTEGATELEEDIEQMQVIDEPERIGVPAENTEKFPLKENAAQLYAKMDLDENVITDKLETPIVKQQNIPEFTYPDYESITNSRYTPFNLYADFNQFTATEKTVINNLSCYNPFDDKSPDHIVERELYGHVSAMLPPIDEEAQFEKILYRKIETYHLVEYTFQSIAMVFFFRCSKYSFLLVLPTNVPK